MDLYDFKQASQDCTGDIVPKQRLKYSSFRLPVFTNVLIFHNLNLYLHLCPRFNSLTWSHWSLMFHVHMEIMLPYITLKSSIYFPIGFPSKLGYAGLFIDELIIQSLILH